MKKFQFPPLNRLTHVLGTGCAVLALMFATTNVSGALIVYTTVVNGSGTLGSSSFSDAQVTYTVDSDTADVYYADASHPTLSTATTTITVAGVGTAVVTDPLLIFVNQNLPKFIIDAAPSLGGGEVLGYAASQFGSYNMMEPIGTITGTYADTYMYPGGEPPGSINTTLGQFQFSGYNLSNDSFTASFVPESSYFGVLSGVSAGLLASAGWLRRRYLHGAC
jgi:hypothetical protein